MAVVVTRMIASFGFKIVGSGTEQTCTFPAPSQHSALMVGLLLVEGVVIRVLGAERLQFRVRPEWGSECRGGRPGRSGFAHRPDRSGRAGRLDNRKERPGQALSGRCRF